jgi:glycosyltransferase involved in cell wall biosynthesis
VQPAVGVVVGSEHVGRVVSDLVGLPPTRMTVVTPGVDIAQMAPQPRASALAGLIAEARRDPPSQGDERSPDPGNAVRLQQFLSDPVRPTVVYVGKLSREKGVHLLLEALADCPPGRCWSGSARSGPLWASRRSTWGSTCCSPAPCSTGTCATCGPWPM